MAIEFKCVCGKKLALKDEHAGRKAKCPACGEINRVPVALLEVEVLEVEVEFLEEGAAQPSESTQQIRPAPLAAATVAPAAVQVLEEKPAQKEKRKKVDKIKEDRGEMARMYFSHAEKDLKKRRRNSKPPKWGSDQDGGYYVFGVALSAGTVTGASMLLVGLLSMITVALFPGIAVRNYRIMIGAVACTALGAITLGNAVFFGQED